MALAPKLSFGQEHHSGSECYWMEGLARTCMTEITAFLFFTLNAREAIGAIVTPAVHLLFKSLWQTVMLEDWLSIFFFLQKFLCFRSFGVNFFFFLPEQPLLWRRYGNYLKSQLRRMWGYGAAILMALTSSWASWVSLWKMQTSTMGRWGVYLFVSARGKCILMYSDNAQQFAVQASWSSALCLKFLDGHVLFSFHVKHFNHSYQYLLCWWLREMYSGFFFSYFFFLPELSFSLS